MKKNVRRVALTGGAVWALLMGVTTLLSVYTGYATDFLNVMASIYPGYSISLPGVVVGLVYGFFDVYVGVYIFTWVYGWFGK